MMRRCAAVEDKLKFFGIDSLSALWERIKESDKEMTQTEVTETLDNLKDAADTAFREVFTKI